jgi:hypothetical protein
VEWSDDIMVYLVRFIKDVDDTPPQLRELMPPVLFRLDKLKRWRDYVTMKSYLPIQQLMILKPKINMYEDTSDMRWGSGMAHNRDFGF